MGLGRLRSNKHDLPSQERLLINHRRQCQRRGFVQQRTRKFHVRRGFEIRLFDPCAGKSVVHLALPLLPLRIVPLV